MKKEIVWHSVHTAPPANGFYFCWHGRWGRVVMGYRDYGIKDESPWGPFPPDQWMEDDGLPVEYPGKL